jgi:hypothetical protein
LISSAGAVADVAEPSAVLELLFPAKLFGMGPVEASTTYPSSAGGVVAVQLTVMDD